MTNSPVKDCGGIIADGVIRSGKTIGSFRRNVLFGLKLMLNSRGYKVTDCCADNLVIVSKGKVENYFYMFGGKDERAQDLIYGITLAGVFF